MTVKRRYPFGPLAEAMGLTENQACVALRLGSHYRYHGMSEQAADRLAVKAGLHPASVWPEMVDHHIDDMLSDRRRRKAETARLRYQKSATVRAKKQVERAAYYAAHGAYERRQNKARYWADVDGARRRRAEYYAVNAEREKAARRARYQAEKEQAS